MNKEEIKKLDIDAFQKAAKTINDLVKKSPSDEFFESVEETDNKNLDELSKVASSNSNNSIENNL